VKGFRTWLFRGLVLASVGLLVWSWFMPWWSAWVWAIDVKDAVVIRPWGLEQNWGLCFDDSRLHKCRRGLPH
jgi:hypothetical protein